jgi:tetratricopeptide (TPR) repeat protein
MRCRIHGLVVGVALSLAAPGARAGAESTPAGSPDPREQRARRLFREGSQLYDQADFDAAIARFEEAYRLSNLPALLFNIAQAYRQKGPGQCATALRYYQHYLQDEPSASNRQEIEELIQEMQTCADAQDAAAAPVPAPVLEPERTAVPATPAVPIAAPPPLPATADVGAAGARWPRWMAIAGASTLGLGVAGYAVALAKYESVKDGGPYPPGHFHRWELLTDASYGLMAVGGAVTIVSTAWLLGHRAPDSGSSVRVSVGLGPLVRLDGRF